MSSTLLADGAIAHPLRSLEEIRCRLQETGFVLVDHLRSEDEAITLAEGLGDIYAHRDSEPSGLTRIRVWDAGGERAGYRGFTGKALLPHTDRSCLADPPDLLIQACARCSVDGGASIVADGRLLYDVLFKEEPELLREMMAASAARFDDGENVYIGPLFEALADGSISLRLRIDDCIFVSGTLALKFSKLLDYIDKLTWRFSLRPGQAYIVNNRWWLHGREAFEGGREMWRILVHSTKRLNIGFHGNKPDWII
jgi:alpha-ketoglutarate-dependent taurine dioxygenase